MQKPFNRALRNLALLVVIALPLGIALVWLGAQLAPPDWAGENGATGASPAAFLYHFLVLLIPVLLGGILHQLLLWSIPAYWASTQRRAVILFTSLVIPLMFWVTGSPLDVLLAPRVVVPLGMALLLYGLLAQPLRQVSPT